MQVTSDTLFHFTNSISNLKNILNQRFKITYCKETFSLNNTSHSYYFPILSFSDIPLSLTKDHITKYGNYGIGMSKEWGVTNQLNPVIYIEQNSIIAKDIQNTLNLLNEILKDFSKTENNSVKKIDSIKELTWANINVIRYIKNYAGDLIRTSKTHKNYRFYDEREWRYVPKWNKDKVSFKNFISSEEEYYTFRKNQKTKPFINGLKINFTCNDIKYLIVKSNKDIPNLIKEIREIDGLIKTANDIEILTTKIITVDQLKSDF